MKILLATDGSDGSKAALDELAKRPWPEGTEVLVLVVEHVFPFIPEPTFMGAAAHLASQDYQKKWGQETLDSALKSLREKATKLVISGKTSVGHAKKAIADEARLWGADLVMLGAHGHGFVEHTILGSVAHATILHAPCSVEVVRAHRPQE